MKKRIISLGIALILLALLPTIASAYEFGNYRLLVDKADILTDSEEADIKAQLDEISYRNEVDVAVVILPSTMNERGEYIPMDPEACANQMFNYHSIGYNGTDDGVLFLVVMDTRDWYITSHGYAAHAITEAGYDRLENEIIPYLSSGDYAQAFSLYGEICDDLISRARSGEPYGYDPDLDYGYPTSNPTSGGWIGVCVLVGVIIAAISVGVMASKNKSVRTKAEANSYVRDGSMRVTVSRDMFLYRNISKVRKSNNNSSGGRSGGGSVSSGRGGKF